MHGPEGRATCRHNLLRMYTEQLLTWLLRISSAVLLLALPAALLPTETMAKIHAWLGLGTMPRGPLVEYLTRSVSLLYALHGGILLALSLDVRRYAPPILALGVLTVAFGLGMLAIDVFAGLPWRWAAVEGVPTAAIGALMAALARRLRPHTLQSADLRE